jgi:RNA polymerase sigma factor (sigma-70 family)
MGGAVRRIHHLLAEGTMAGLPDGQLLERFLARGDGAAFAALVERHGPMVLGVCRSVLGDPADAEDAFQATFLVLVCKGRSIRDAEALGGWLRQVAHRIAVQAGADADRRRARERRAVAVRAAAPHRDEPKDDRRRILHEELDRLSDKYRLPLLLCDLEGKTHAQAAAELGCGPATVQRRLNGARALLRSRLIRRGIAPTACGLAATFGHSAAAQVPPGWVEATLRAAASLGSQAGRLAVGDVVSSAAAALASQSLRAMSLSQLKAGAAAAVFLIALVGVAWRAGLAAQDKTGPGAAPRMQQTPAASAPSPDRARAAAEPAGPKETIRYQGQVLDPDGKPFAGAALYLMSDRLKHPDDLPIRATTGADGRFRFEVPKSDFDRSFGDEPWSGATLLARASGLAFGMANADKDPKEWTLRLARDDVPISGRIIDLQGRPVVGAAVTVLSVGATSNGRLDDYLKALEERSNVVGDLEEEFFPLMIYNQPERPVIPPARTGTDGRFRFAGIGRERVALLLIEGPTIETKCVMVRTRPGATSRLPVMKGADELDPEDRPAPLTFYCATFDHVAGPTRPIEGVVRDLDTGRPLEGIMVHGEDTAGWLEDIQALTDARGRYRLVGLPRGREGHVLAVPPCDFPDGGLRRAKPKVPPAETLPYLLARVAVGKAETQAPVHLDINLKRGVWVTGRILDRDTRKPVAGSVEYFVFEDNPHLERYPPPFEGKMRRSHSAGTDGVFHLVAVPGPGVLTALADEPRYIRAAGVEKLKGRVKNGYLETHPYNAEPSNFHFIDPIDPAPTSLSMTHDLLLESGRSLPVTVLGPDGKPLTPNELITVGLTDRSWWEKVPAGTSDLKIVALAPGKGRTVGFGHKARQLVGELVLRGDETGPQTVTLRPWSVLTGRVVDADGQPLGGGNVFVSEREGPREVSVPVDGSEVGKDGRFRIEGLLPGDSYNLQILSDAGIARGFIAVGVSVGPGETKGLGDVTPKISPME